MQRPALTLALATLSLLAGCYQGTAQGPDDPGQTSDTGDSGPPDATDSTDSADTGEAPIGEVVPEPLHRLNRLEYNNTVRDLLATTLTPADNFPPDNVTLGFDNIAEGLTLTPAQMDLYATAARELATAALETAPRYVRRTGARGHATATAQAGVAFDWGWSMSRHGELLSLPTIDLAQDELLTLSILAGGDAVGMPTPEMSLIVDNVEVGHWLITSLPTTPIVYSVQVPLPAGSHTVAVGFPNGADQPAENIFNSLVVGYLDITSEATVVPAGRALVYTCEPAQVPVPEDCYRTIVTGFAARAWRRPLTAPESDALFNLWQQLRAAEGDDVAVGLVVRAVLMSSKFLYRPSFAAAGTGSPEGPALLDDYVLASRLSYFLWSSMPDAALFEAAAAGTLRSEDGLRDEVQRMLGDARATGLRRGFASQWLATRALTHHTPDPATFPGFDEPLRAAMIAETELFFGDFMINNRPIGEMMNPDFAYLNDRLAQHYHLPLPGTATPTRTTLPAGARRGLLMQGAWLTANSASNRTSPVNRGRWLLEQVLCTPIPPPPPDIPPLMPPAEGQTQREMLAEHRANPACASCHNLLDPAGLGLEGYDGVGAERDLENGRPVDVSGALPGATPEGTPFSGSGELAALLEDDPRFVECLTNKLFTYALGRQKKLPDVPHRKAIDAALPEVGGTLDGLIELIVTSPAFRMTSEKAQ